LANEGSIVISTQHPCMSVLKDKTLEVARKRSAEGVTELIARGYRIEYIYILLELNHPCSRSCPIIEAVILTDYIIAKHNPGMQ
ncbi:hypothetical protein ACYCNR_26495, partial [Klebsiella pneumoniae]